MDLFDAIEKRHSYRGPFKDQPVPREDLKRIVQAGLQARRGGIARPRRSSSWTTRTSSPGSVDAPGNTAMQQAHAYIACAVDKEPAAVYEGMAFQVEDCAVAAENMLLAVTALGYATVWVDGWLRVGDHAARIGEALGLPEGKVVRIILPLGEPAETHKQKEKFPSKARVVQSLRRSLRRTGFGRGE